MEKKWKDFEDTEEAKLVGFSDRSAKEQGVRLRAVLKISDLLNWIDSVHTTENLCSGQVYLRGTGDVVLHTVV